MEGKELAPDYSKCNEVFYSESIEPKSCFGAGFLRWLEPTATLTEQQVMDIRNGKSSIHFYGFAKYQDIFGHHKRTTVHLRWEMRWGGMVEGQIMEWWEPVGQPWENTDTVEDNPS